MYRLSPFHYLEKRLVYSLGSSLLPLVLKIVVLLLVVWSAAIGFLQEERSLKIGVFAIMVP
jgi:hypothetical protein